MARPSYGRFTDGTNTPTEILASTVGLEKMGIMVSTAVVAKIVKGTVMGIITATGLAIPYLTAAVDGSGVAVGIISDDFDPTLSTDQSDLRLAANMYIHGSFVEANLTGIDSDAKVDLKGRTIGTVFTF
jgi:hypothetical protein